LKNITAVKIDAFSFEYNEVQDRILLSGNLYNEGREIRFWLTRRLALRLLNAAADLIEKTSPSVISSPVDHKGAMASFEHQRAQQDQSNVTTGSGSPVSSVSNAEAVIEPSILKRLDISYQNKFYKLAFYTSNSNEVAASSQVDSNQLHQIISFIHQGAKSLEWGAVENLFEPAQASTYTLQ